MLVAVDMVAEPFGSNDLIVLSSAPWNECMSILLFILLLSLDHIINRY
jgi:hypothetical protein